MNRIYELLMALTPLWIFLLLVIYLLVLMFAISLLGWRPWGKSLGSHSPEEPIRSRYYWRTGYFSWWLSYNNCLRVAFEKDGMYVRPIPPFHVFHPWLWLPWTSVVASQQKTFWAIPYLRVHFCNTKGQNFYLCLPPQAISLLPKEIETKTN